MSNRRNSRSSCGVIVLLIVLVVAGIFVYRAGLMPPPVVQFLDPIAKQMEPVGKRLEPIAKQLEPVGKQLDAIGKQLQAFVNSSTGTAQSPTPVPEP